MSFTSSKIIGIKRIAKLVIKANCCIDWPLIKAFAPATSSLGAVVKVHVSAPHEYEDNIIFAV